MHCPELAAEMWRHKQRSERQLAHGIRQTPNIPEAVPHKAAGGARPDPKGKRGGGGERARQGPRDRPGRPEPTGQRPAPSQQKFEQPRMILVSCTTEE